MTKIAVYHEKVIQNGVSRPREKYEDGRPKQSFIIWKFADEITEAKNAKAKAEAKKKRKGPPPLVPATRQEVLKACAAAKIPLHTFVNHFYQWRKFNGFETPVEKKVATSKVAAK